MFSAIIRHHERVVSYNAVNIFLYFVNSWLIFGPYLVQMKVEEDLVTHGRAA